MTAPTNDAPVTVEQCDRDAAADELRAFYSVRADFAEAVRTDTPENNAHRLVQAFARHRLAALASAPAGDGVEAPVRNLAFEIAREALARPRAAVGERERAQHIETLKWLKSGYLPGGPRDVWGACQAGINALQSPPAKVEP